MKCVEGWECMGLRWAAQSMESAGSVVLSRTRKPAIFQCTVVCCTSDAFVRVADDLPRTETFKVLKRVLKAEGAGGPGWWQLTADRRYQPV